MASASHSKERKSKHSILGTTLALAAWILLAQSTFGQVWTRVEVDNPAREGVFGYRLGVIDNLPLVSWRGDNTIANYAGAVLVYELTDNGPVYKERILGSSTEDHDQFGEGFVINGSDLFVQESHNGRDIYNFRYADGEFEETQKLPLPDLDDFDDYPVPIAADGDWLLARAYGRSSSSPQYRGTIFVFKRVDGTWQLHSRIDPPEPVDDRSFFGRAITIEGSNLIVGEERDGSGGDRELVTRYYELTGDSWELRSNISTSSPMLEVDPWTVSFSGESEFEARAGNYLLRFQKYGINWLEVDRRQFLPESFDMDGYHRYNQRGDFLFVTSHVQSTLAYDIDVVDVFRKTDGEIAWEWVTRLQPPDPGEWDDFGWDVALSDDWLIFSAPQRDLDFTQDGGTFKDEVGVFYYARRDAVIPTAAERVITPALDVNLDAFPNPTQGLVTLEYTSSSAELVSISIYDVTGRLVREKRSNKSQGILTTSIDLSLFPFGIYFCRVTAGTNSAVRSIAVVH